MITRLFLILGLGTLLLFSCEDPQKKEREALYKEVMEIHDEMMPLIFSAIRPAQKKLKPMMEEALAQQDSVNYKKYKTAYNQLEKADSAMNKWMKQFKNPDVDISQEEAIRYLKDQKVKVNDMKAVMEKNMDAAKAVIEF
ncbi:MAG: hypothetical protein AAF573_16005 [Bacteroidota bacterium]